MLHPQAKFLLDLIVERNIPPTHTLSPAEARAFYRERRTLTQPEPPAIAETRELQAGGPQGAIPLRLYQPQPAAQRGSAPPVLVYFHGGGWVIGDLDTHDTLCRELAIGAGCAVLAVDYRMGPEHRFPAAVDDCIAATRWVRDHAAQLGIDASRLAVGGDSAGGNLAAVVAIAMRDAGDLPVRFQLLIYPATDQRRGWPSHTSNGQGYLLTAETMDYFHDHYITDKAMDLDWRASPLLHPDLSNLPPALVLTAGYDPLRDEALQYSHRLTQAGNRATHINFERQIHGFITMGKVIDEANAAVQICAAELRRALA
ncbi:MAG TPA: alpha/beta hydrolase [Rubrivivax sp.]|nr:alpha/beta hydrolase [Rubrivivax sp.]